MPVLSRMLGNHTEGEKRLALLTMLPNNDVAPFIDLHGGSAELSDVVVVVYLLHHLFIRTDSLYPQTYRL